MPRRKGLRDQNYDVSERDLLAIWPEGRVPADTNYDSFMRSMARYCGWVDGPVNLEVFGNPTDTRWFIANHVDREVREFSDYDLYPEPISWKIRQHNRPE